MSWKRQPDRSYFNRVLRVLVYKDGPMRGGKRSYCARSLETGRSSCGHRTLKAAKAAGERLVR